MRNLKPEKPGPPGVFAASVVTCWRGGHRPGNAIAESGANGPCTLADERCGHLIGDQGVNRVDGVVDSPGDRVAVNGVLSASQCPTDGGHCGVLDPAEGVANLVQPAHVDPLLIGYHRAYELPEPRSGVRVVGHLNPCGQVLGHRGRVGLVRVRDTEGGRAGSRASPCAVRHRRSRLLGRLTQPYYRVQGVRRSRGRLCP
jgi:hypothetical protein